MDILQALWLGILQGLTEYLPVSSSGHLVIGAEILGVKGGDENLLFSVVVHAATSLSSLVIFRKAVMELIKDLLKFEWNDGTRYVAMLAVSALPVVIVGLFFKDEVEALFDGDVGLVGAMWMVTGALLLFTYFVKKHDRPLGFGNTLLMGIAQAIAVIPGISRSGATIATGLLTKADKTKLAQFSFLMVIVPILGQAALDVKSILDGEVSVSRSEAGSLPLIVGFIAAFVVGLLACKAMIAIVNRNKLYYFSIYCFVVGAIALAYTAGLF